MIVGSELTVLKDDDSYQADALRLALSISPYSIPCDKSLGLSITRSSNIELLTRSRVTDLISNLGLSSNVRCESCKVEKGNIKLIISKSSDSDTVTEFTLS